MILTDQILRYLSKDIMLPKRCHATKKQLVSVKECCDCKIFCKKPPKGSVPAYAFIRLPLSGKLKANMPCDSKDR